MHLPDAPPDDLLLDGRRHYFGAKKKSWYRLHEDRTRGGTPVVLGWFGNFRSSYGQWRVEVDWKGISDDERAAMRARQIEVERMHRAERAEAARLAGLSAGELWRSASRTGSSAYLTRKGVAGESCRYLRDGSVLIPLVRFDMPRGEALRGLQRIYPGPRGVDRHGDKLPEKVFTRGFDPTGAACRLGDVVPGRPLLVVEGYATGGTVRAATGRLLPVFVALNAGNLASVVQVLRGLFPEAAIVICGDDDWKTKDAAGKPDNVGRRKAIDASRQVDGCVPVFPAFGPNRADGWTDFNDLMLAEGLPVVQRQLARVLAWVEGGQP